VLEQVQALKGPMDLIQFFLQLLAQVVAVAQEPQQEVQE
jgi:hypothetical protein